MLCYRCGSHVADGSDLCPNCGQKFPATGSREGVHPKAAAGPAQFRFKAGDVLAGRYKVKSILGSGETGEVYRVHDSEISVDVALKVIREGVLPGEDEREAFLAGMKPARRLSHPNIIRLYDIDRDGAAVFCAMQLLEGLTLRKVISLRAEKGQNFSLSEVEPIFSQLALGLEYAHQFTFHGAIKPDNVIVLPDLLKITDFYLMSAVGRERYVERQKARLESIRYMAPEIRYEREGGGVRSDIWSLGAILFEMLTGMPYEGGKAVPSAVHSDVPPQADALCAKALAENPAQRHESASAFMKELSATLDETYNPPVVETVQTAEKAPKEAIEDVDELEIEPIPAGQVERMPEPAAAPVKPAEPVSGRSRRVSFGFEEELLPAGGAAPAEPEHLEMTDAEILEEEPLPAAPPAQPVQAAPAPPPPALAPAPLAGIPMPAPVAAPAIQPEQKQAQSASPVIRPEPAAASVPPPMPLRAPATPATPSAPPAPVPIPVAPVVQVPVQIPVAAPVQPPSAPPPALVPAAPVHAPVQPPGAAYIPPSAPPATAPSAPPAPAAQAYAPPQSARPVSQPVYAQHPGVPFTVEKPRVPTVIIKAHKRHLRTMILLFLVLFVILIGAGLLVWNQMEKQRAQEREFMEAQKQQLEEQRKGIENAQKELLTQLSDAKRAVDEKKKVAELQKTAEPEPEAKPVAKPEPFEEEKKVAEIETQLAKLRDQARVTARKTAEIEVAMPPPPKEDRSAKLEAERRRAEDKKAAAEARKLEQERKREEAKKAREEAVQKAAEEKKAKEEAAKKAEEERLAAEAARGPECPKGMILIPAGAFKFGSSPNDPMKGMGEKNNETVNLSVYCIDIFEFPNKSGKQPAVNVSFNAAEASCKKAGKRLCTEAEWEKACKGPGGLRYPYGNSWEADACNQADEAGNKKSVAVAGASTKCKSGYGAADMSGNAAEWVETGGGNKALKGGGADKPNFAVRCAARVSADPGKTGPTFGFRCCAEPE